MDNIIRLFTIPELRNKLLFIFGILVVFRIAATIPVPGVDVLQLRAFFEGNQFFGFLNIFSGGAMNNLSIIMLGLGPYITASIIMQLLTMMSSNLREIYLKSGEQGRAKFNQYGRLLTVPLAAIQGFGFLKFLQAQQILPALSPTQMATDIILIVAGTVFLMWLGELITEKQLGNGVSFIIFAGIVVNIPGVLIRAIQTFDSAQIPSLVAFALISLFVIAAVVLLNESYRNVSVSYAKRVRGSRMYGGVSTHIPIKLNSAGVIPIIFAVSIILFPRMVGEFMAVSGNHFISGAGTFFRDIFQNQTIYVLIYFILIVVFTFFYTAVVFDPKNVSENLQKQGGFISGIRPGQPTADFLTYIINRVTLSGAIFLGLVAVIPFIVTAVTGLATLTIGGVSVLIVVAVVLDVMKHVQAQLVMREYEGL